jgi:hypothetical protein
MFRRSLVLLRHRSRFCGRRAQMGYLTYQTLDLSRVPGSIKIIEGMEKPERVKVRSGDNWG